MTVIMGGGAGGRWNILQHIFVIIFEDESAVNLQACLFHRWLFGDIVSIKTFLRRALVDFIRFGHRNGLLVIAPGSFSHLFVGVVSVVSDVGVILLAALVHGLAKARGFNVRFFHAQRNTLPLGVDSENDSLDRSANCRNRGRQVFKGFIRHFTLVAKPREPQKGEEHTKRLNRFHIGLDYRAFHQVLQRFCLLVFPALEGHVEPLLVNVDGRNPSLNETARDEGSRGVGDVHVGCVGKKNAGRNISTNIQENTLL
mmetsp:Transcript_5423/g.13049  ORF Transcript_5423/g.13049 Transcript_5423/m.13049 type:complete len:256 (+) Transcript_5423:1130-1897(+)